LIEYRRSTTAQGSCLLHYKCSAVLPWMAGMIQFADSSCFFLQEEDQQTS